jgi:hypothetical protein
MLMVPILMWTVRGAALRSRRTLVLDLRANLGPPVMSPLYPKVILSTVTVAGSLVLVEGGARLAEAFLTSGSLPATALAGTAIGTDWLDILERDLTPRRGAAALRSRRRAVLEVAARKLA